MRASFLTIIFLAWHLLLAHQLFAKSDSIDVTSVSNSVKILRVNSKIGNTNSVLIKGKNNSLLIDPNFNQSSTLINAELKALGIKSPKYVSVTHVHRDHVEQLPLFLDKDSQLLISKEQLANLKEDKLIPETTAVELVDNAHSVDLGNVEVKVIKLPATKAHTQGDLVYWLEGEKVLIVGDYLFTHGYPIIDKHIGDVNGYFGNLDFLSNNFSSVNQVVAGHSTISPAPQKVFSFEEFTSRVSDLKHSVCLIKSKKDSGLSLVDVIQSGLGDRLEKVNRDAVFVKEKRWIEYVYDREVNFC